MFGALKRNGVLGINRRNVDYTLRWNERSRYPLVDNKLKTKDLCLRAGIPTPKLLAFARHHFELRDMIDRISKLDRFALKPVRGAQGNGIVVIKGRRGDEFIRAGDRTMSKDELFYHSSGIISGLYALGGDEDMVMAEELLVVHPSLAAISMDGVPDIRIIVYRDFPVMAMARLPTAESTGRANLHQGAVAVGIDITTGVTASAVQHDGAIEAHPDTGHPLIGLSIPSFARALEIAVRVTEQSGLGYVGADIVLDARLGPVILEMNARPGLAIQNANRAGLLIRLDSIDRAWEPGLSVEARIERMHELAPTWRAPI